MSRETEKKNIICDLDGTIALDHHRNHFLHQEGCTGPGCGCKRDWDGYYAACEGDFPNWPVIDLLRLFWEDGYKIHIISGRVERTLEVTSKWLRNHAVPHTSLHLRPEGVFTQDNLLKIVRAKSLGLEPDNVIFCLEDRQRVVDAWREYGYTCFQVAPGTF